ncbi:WD repeat domain-containing protein [Microdochium trichocladiopsis]|uniref:WD repeat domain-containing protein n=1 Tax=Microdochium trichocladiopsis TaxID=1682393 RepID=A0A9P9BNX4_9PEZI|nr:WD repeat domain-containing protein [Microdochium trichocladiopsis]KAH7028166.1 WD repeat domain-containing protein [Microdochium trichocladiopsis]
MAPSRSPSWAPSATIQSTQHPIPELHHSLKHDSSVLALTVSDDRIYAGTQDGEIVVWSLSTYRQLHSIQAHKRSVLSLFLSDDGTMLFSSAASDPIVNVWCPTTMRRLYEIYSTNDSFGDIFSVAYSPQHQTVYYGAQNTSIQWASLSDLKQQVAHDSANHPDRRNHRFFDSRAVGGGASTPRMTDERFELIPRSHTVIETDKRANLMYAHYGFIYCMMIAKGLTALADADEELLVTGGGDGTIKAWKLGSKDAAPDGLEHGLEEVMMLGEEDANSIMSLQVDGSFLYSGKLSGVIELWDLDTQQKLRQIKAHDGNVWSLQMGWGYLWSVGSSGTASKHSTVQYGKYQPTESQNVSQKYQCLTKWHAHNGKILASVVTTHDNNQLYITGANDNSVSVWMLGNEAKTDPESHEESEDMMVTSLREFVSYKTISSNPEYAEDCRQGATWLRSLFKKLGAEVEMLHADDILHHPVVFAKFTGKQRAGEKRKRVLFYGHYDVVPADTKDAKWDSDPFQLKGENGFLYGRGVSDNKGPIMAALYAVTDLMQAKSLDSDVLFLIEGQEESGSSGFRRTVRKHKDTIGHVDYILLANSYWLNDDMPCLTYGLRGVMHATVCVESQRPDLHSGVDGSYMINEPMSDLMTILSKLKGPRNTIMLPGFYANIPSLTSEEEARYDAIIDALGIRAKGKTVADNLKKSLMARWREPNLTQHAVNVSGSGGGLISSHASAKISIRLVPGQEVQETVDALTSYLQSEFDNLVSDNLLTVQIDNTAEPWLGDPDSYIFRTLEEAVVKAWSPLFSADNSSDTDESDAKEIVPAGTAKRIGPSKPLYIREGGSIPAIRFLEKEFDAPAAHLPCGQASDAAHLNNEKLRVENLFKSREIFADVFRRL